MEGRKQTSSLLVSSLCGAKEEETTSSPGIFRTLFEPPPRDPLMEILQLSETEKKDGYGNQACSKSKTDKNSTIEQVKNQDMDFCAYGRGQTPHPSLYSSSIYYGGQEIYCQSERARNTSLTTVSKNKGEEKAGNDVQGNWWQGSYHY